MKIRYLLLLILGVALFACDEVDESETVDLVTTLEIEIPIATLEPSMLKIKSAEEASAHMFGGTEIMSFTEDDELVDYIDNIKEIQLMEGAVLVFNGINEGDEIGQLELVWGYCQEKSGEYTMHPSVALSGAEHDVEEKTLSYSLDDFLPDLMNYLEYHPGDFYKIRISGTANFVPLSPLKMLIPVVIKASPLRS